MDYSTIEEVKDLLLSSEELSDEDRSQLKEVLKDYNFHVGRTWKTAKKDILLLLANAIDGRTGNEPEFQDGECIIDFYDKLYSVSGKLVDGKIFIDDNAIIYDPVNGIVSISPQERWQKNNNLITKSYKLNRELVEEFADSCKAAGTTQAGQLSKMMKNFIIDVELNAKLEN